MGVTFPAPAQTGLGAHPASYTMGTGSILGVELPGRGVAHSPHLAPRLKSRAIPLLHLCGPDSVVGMATGYGLDGPA